MELTQEQKRIKIAEACGMTGWQEARSLPNYFNDLNAMHEAEKSLSEGLYTIFCDHLHGLACEEQLQTGKWRWLSSTASQRAEAFGKTLYLW